MKRPNVNIGYWKEVKVLGNKKAAHVRDWTQYHKDIEKYIDYLETKLSERQQPIETKQESKSDVTQQRDTLIAFCNHLSKQELQTTYWLDESDVDEFLKSNLAQNYICRIN